MLLATVTLWIGGFDLIYACQDVEYDRLDQLHSIPARFGIPFALRLSAVCHVFTVLLLAGVGWLMALGWPYWAGMGIVCLLLIWEHSLVHPDDLSHLDMAFFNINSYISITLFISVFAAIYLV
jgi:4-hydroxybenzoate polyprenyltransferase